jgi:PAS domain S-box-containing protein
LIKNQQETETQNNSVGEFDRPLGCLREWVVKSPIGAFVVVAVTVFVAESLSSWILLERLPVLEHIEPLVEFMLNVGIVLPVFIYLFVLPTARNIRQREATERALRTAHEELEVKVRERTRDLEQSNKRLRQEVDGRRRAQQAVEFQASLLDAVREAVVATDGKGRILYWNRFAEVLYGWKATEAVGSKLDDVITFLQDSGQRLDVLTKCGKELGCNGEVEALRRDGSRFPAYLHCSCLPDEAAGYVCLSFDFTEWKIAEEALRDSEEKYSNLVENSPTGVFTLQDGKFVFVNPRFARILEYSRAELLQIEASHLVHPDDRERVAEIARKQVVDEPASYHYECRLITKTGQVRWVAICNAMIRNNGEIATLGNVQDVTDRKRMERELHQLSARLLTIQEEERRRVARDLHDSVGQKLTGIKFMVEAALGAPWPEERRWGMERLRSLVPTIQDAVEEVRCISTELRPSILDDLGLLPTIAWYVREFEKAHPSILVEQQLQATESDVPPGLRTSIFRILQEATNNLAKHSSASHLLIGLQCDERSLRLRVQDDGVGFEPEAAAEAGKVGSGLSSMRERAELSGGTFSLSSVPGAGTLIVAEWRLDPSVSG